MHTIYDAPNGLAASTDFGAPGDMLETLIRLFIEGSAFPWAIVRSAVNPPVVEALEALGLLTSSAVDGELCIAPVALYPLQGVYVASERHGEIMAVATAMPADIVYAALTRQARQFVHFMPHRPCTDYLDLCSGTGIAALIAAQQFAVRSTAIDVTERSTRFARFNAALNGLANATMLQGDLFDPVAEQTFDIITAHPPFVPTHENTMVFRDGGEDGEQVTRRIIGGVADHLRPGGLCYLSCMITDRTGRPLEHRIREMLGPLESEFDVVVGQTEDYDVEKQFSIQVDDKEIGPEVFARMRERFAALEVERFIGGVFLIGRRAERASRTSVTRRRVTSAATTGAHLQWYLDWSTLVETRAGESEWLLDARPRSVDQTECRSRSLLSGGRWTMTDAALVTHTPFEAQATCPPWCATLLSWCDGRDTAREHLKRLRDLGVLPTDLADAAFAAIIRNLADSGFLDLDVFPLPTAGSVSLSRDPPSSIA